MRHATGVTLDTLIRQLQKPDIRCVMVLDTVSDISLRALSLPETQQKDQVTIIDSKNNLISSGADEDTTLSAGEAESLRGF